MPDRAGAVDFAEPIGKPVSEPERVTQPTAYDTAAEPIIVAHAPANYAATRTAG